MFPLRERAHGHLEWKVEGEKGQRAALLQRHLISTLPRPPTGCAPPSVGPLGVSVLPLPSPHPTLPQWPREECGGAGPRTGSRRAWAIPPTGTRRWPPSQAESDGASPGAAAAAGEGGGGGQPPRAAAAAADGDATLVFVAPPHAPHFLRRLVACDRQPLQWAGAQLGDHSARRRGRSAQGAVDVGALGVAGGRYPGVAAADGEPSPSMMPTHRHVATAAAATLRACSTVDHPVQRAEPRRGPQWAELVEPLPGAPPPPAGVGSCPAAPTPW